MRAHYPEGSTENFVDVRNKIAASSASMPAGVSAGSVSYLVVFCCAKNFKCNVSYIVLNQNQIFIILAVLRRSV